MSNVSMVSIHFREDTETRVRHLESRGEPFAAIDFGGYDTTLMVTKEAAARLIEVLREAFPSE